MNSLYLGATVLYGFLGVALLVIIYKAMHDDQDGDDALSVFPTTILFITVLCTFGALFWVVGRSLYINHLLAETAINGEQTRAGNIDWISLIAISLSIILAAMWFFSLRRLQLWRRIVRNNRALLRTILDNMPLALVAKDVSRDYRWLFINRIAEEMFCLKNEAIVGRLDADLFPKNEADFFRRTDETVIAGGKLVDIEAEPITTSKGTFTGHTIKVPIYNEKGQPYILLGMIEDVTDKIKVKEDLYQAKKRAEAADQAKSEFLANMSHELRTPMNGILGMLRLLIEADLKEEHRILAQTAFRSSENLLEIVNDILDLSKIEAKEMRLEYIGFDPLYIIDGVVQNLNTIAREKHIEIRRSYEKEKHPFVFGDPTRFGGILMNLIGNAIKYTDKGHIDIRIVSKKLDERHSELRCEITDTGVGIPKDRLNAVFEKFAQADTSTTRKYGGTGLGLAITRQLVELMGGQIGVESEPGHGTTFWFEIPFEVTDEVYRENRIRRLKATLGTLSPAEVRILVAEDHPVNQIFIRKLLQKFGVRHFTIVENGLEVLKAAAESAWDIILMDCHMPEMNGYDATKKIRNLEQGSDKQVAIIAMTANAMVGDKEKCLRCGMDEYISKPINSDELKEILGQWILFEDIARHDQKPKNMGTVDFDHLHAVTDGDKAVQKEVIEAFTVQSDSNLQTLKENCIAGENKAWAEASHMFKGGSSSIGANRLSQLCNQAQHTSGVTANERAELLKKIDEEYTRVKSDLRLMGFGA